VLPRPADRDGLEGLFAVGHVDLLGEIKFNETHAWFQRGVTEYPLIGDVCELLTHDELLLIYDISGRGFTRFRGGVGLENVAALTQGETLLGRFLIFDTEPDMDRLVPPTPGTPLPPAPRLTTVPEVVDRVFWYALGRAPSAEERSIAESTLRDPARPGRASPDGLADLLWAVLMKPEFQLIY